MLKIGHRGAPGYPRFAENTIFSFKKAIQDGANALEFDVRRSKDGKLVVIHDLSVQRTTGNFGKVCDMTYEEISVLDAGYGEKIPLLEDVLSCFGKKALLNIEIKEKGIEHNVLTAIQNFNLERNVLISAFDFDDNDSDSNSSWNQLDIFAGKIPTAFLVSGSKIRSADWNKLLKKACDKKISAIHPENQGVTAEMISSAHEAGLLVNVWTVNDKKRILELKQMEVDGIFSDFPEIL